MVVFLYKYATSMAKKINYDLIRSINSLENERQNMIQKVMAST